MATLTQYDNGGNYTPEQLERIYDSVEVYSVSSTRIRFKATVGDFESNVYGNGFAFDTYGNPVGGTVTSVDERLDGAPVYTISGFSVPLSTFVYGSDATIEQAVFAGADTLNGAPTYDDDLKGHAGNDAIFGNGGNDRLDGGAGDDAMAGGIGDDTYVVDSVGDSVTEAAGAGADEVISSITYALAAALENLTLGGNARIDGSGNDLDNVITGNRSMNRLWGHGGNDVMNGEAGDDVIDGGAGNDTLDGGTGNDILIGGAGNDRMAGGAGSDTYHVDASRDKIVELDSPGTDVVFASATFTLSDGLENLTLVGSRAINGTGNDQDNILTGNDAANELSGGLGSDELYGGGGNDILRGGGGGADILYGGTGDDTYYDSPNIYEEEGEGIDTLVASFSGGSFVLDSNVENLIMVGAAVSWTGNELDNTIVGNDLDNTINGLFGNDTIYGGGGNDLLFASGSTLYGGQGDDRYIGAGNTVIELAGEGIDYVQSETDFVLGDNIENLTVGLSYGSDSSGTGNALNNTITGGNGHNRLDGGAGADLLVGRGGNDTYVVDNARDVIEESSRRDIDTVISSIAWTLGDNVENLTLAGAATKGTGNAAANVLTGNAAANNLSGLGGNDSLLGGVGNDTLSGGLGGDTLQGGTGNDTLTGGDGRDYFVFNLAEGPVGRDRVLDFTDALDKLKLLGGPASFAEFIAGGGSIVGKGADTLIYFDETHQDYLRLVGIDAAAIGRGDFLFA